MSLVAGTVSVHPTTGAVSGSGYARTLYDAEAAAMPFLEGDLAAFLTANYPPPFENLGANLLPLRLGVAAKCNALAAAHAAFIQSATVTVPVPSTPTTAIGVVT